MYALRALAILIALLGVVIFVLGSHNFIISSFGLLALLASVQRGRMSRAQNQNFGRLDLTGSNQVGPTTWFIGLALLLLAGFSYWLLHIDAAHGRHAVWPVYVFAGVALACAGVWGYIGSKLVL
jgi:hypothetical protein